MAEETYALLKSSISRNELDETAFFLAKVPLEKMSQENTDTLLQSLMSLAYQSDSMDIANFLLEEFDKIQTNDERNLTSFTRLFTFPTFPDAALKWLIDTLDNESYMFVMDELIKFDSSDDLLPAYVRITELFGIQDADTFSQCLELARSDDNTTAVWFFSTRLANTSEYAPEKKYVKNYLPEVPLYKDLKIPEAKFEALSLPPLDQVVDLLTAGLDTTTDLDEQQIAKTRELLRKQLEAKTDAEVFDTVRSVLLNQQYFKLHENTELFRIMGPVNPEYKADLTFEHICYSQGGGHRMFYCTCYEIDIDDTPREDWFIGFCQFCLQRIKNRAHAIRRPLSAGGFRGCYCSASCVKNSTSQVDILLNLMLDEMTESLNTIGIQDRLEDPDDKLPLADTEVRLPTYGDDY